MALPKATSNSRSNIIFCQQKTLVAAKNHKKHLILKNSFLCISQSLSTLAKEPNPALPKTISTHHLDLVATFKYHLYQHLAALFLQNIINGRTCLQPHQAISSQTSIIIHHWKAYGASVLGQQHQKTIVSQLSINFGKISTSSFCLINTCF